MILTATWVADLAVLVRRAGAGEYTPPTFDHHEGDWYSPVGAPIDHPEENPDLRSRRSHAIDRTLQHYEAGRLCRVCNVATPYGSNDDHDMDAEAAWNHVGHRMRPQ